MRKLSWNKKELKGSVNLPASKSIANRLLIIRSLSQHPFEISNLSDADDTQNLKKNLDLILSNQNSSLTLDVGPAGTNMRFLTAFLANRPGEFVLKGSERMHQRPIKPLVDALKQLGAEITYLEKEGYPPLKIRGKRLIEKEVAIAADISSQYITALMMIGATLPEGLQLKLSEEVVSKDYILMTASLMHLCGALVSFQEHQMRIAPQKYSQTEPIGVESDWTAASYWYAMLALVGKGRLKLIGLKQHSLQGDAVLKEWMKEYGVETVFDEEGAIISCNESKRPAYFEKDFTRNPDLAQTFIVLNAALGIQSRYSGLKTLRIKETDRLLAMQTELAKVGVKLNFSNDEAWMEPSQLHPAKEKINTYHDHRMAMAMAMLTIKTDGIIIQNPEVVSKSYPAFWSEMSKEGLCG